MFSRGFFCHEIFQDLLWLNSVLIVHCYPLLALYFLILGTPSPFFLSSPLFSPPSLALASNGLNRLASCQSRGLLWLCHKSARKNRNHLFRPGPERGWGCKYMSLALAHVHTQDHRAQRRIVLSHLSQTSACSWKQWLIIKVFIFHTCWPLVQKGWCLFKWMKINTAILQIIIKEINASCNKYQYHSMKDKTPDMSLSRGSTSRKHGCT